MQEERSQGQKGQQADPNAAGARGSNYEENEQELLCVCQQPYNVDTAMISCDVCEDWYHLRCVGMTQTAAKSMKKYTCPVCVALKGNAEPLDAALAKVCFLFLADSQACSLYAGKVCVKTLHLFCGMSACAHAQSKLMPACLLTLRNTPGACCRCNARLHSCGAHICICLCVLALQQVELFLHAANSYIVTMLIYSLFACFANPCQSSA